MRAVRLLSLFLLVATFCVGLVSCAGNGAPQPSGRGRLTLTVRWPSTRDIPPETGSLRITAKTLAQDSSGQMNEDVQVADELVQRPSGQTTSQITLDDLPSVAVRVRVQAYASTDGSGTAIASGLADAQVPEDQTVQVAITLQSTSAPLTVEGGSDSVMGFCQEENFDASQNGSVPVSWSVSGGGTIGYADGPPDYTGRFVSGHTAGTFTVTATKIGDPATTGTASITVSPLVGFFNSGSNFVRVERAHAPGETTVLQLAFNRELYGYVVDPMASSFTGTPSNSGSPGTITGSVSGDTLTIHWPMPDSAPMTFTRECS